MREDKIKVDFGELDYEGYTE